MSEITSFFLLLDQMHLLETGASLCCTMASRNSPRQSLALKDLDIGVHPDLHKPSKGSFHVHSVLVLDQDPFPTLGPKPAMKRLFLHRVAPVLHGSLHPGERPFRHCAIPPSVVKAFHQHTPRCLLPRLLFLLDGR